MVCVGEVCVCVICVCHCMCDVCDVCDMYVCWYRCWTTAGRVGCGLESALVV